MVKRDGPASKRYPFPEISVIFPPASDFCSKTCTSKPALASLMAAVSPQCLHRLLLLSSPKYYNLQVVLFVSLF